MYFQIFNGVFTRFLVLISILFSALILHAECPSSIYYSNGRILKSGNSLYYSSGHLLKSGGSLYYSNGSLLKSGNSIYYPNGSLLKSGGSIYYPNGSLLKSGGSLYYQNGSMLKSGNSFYYHNGRIARSGATLYSEAGHITTFPLRIKESIGNLGSLLAFISSDDEKVTLNFPKLVSDQLVQLKHIHNVFEDESRNKMSFEFMINSGVESEDIIVNVDGEGDITCSFLDNGDN